MLKTWLLGEYYTCSTNLKCIMMFNKGSIFAGFLILLLVFVLSGCGHKQMVNKSKSTINFGNRPKITQLADGTFVYKDKKYDGTDDMVFGF